MKIFLMLLLLSSCTSYLLPEYTKEEEKIMTIRWSEFMEDQAQKERLKQQRINNFNDFR